MATILRLIEYADIPAPLHAALVELLSLVNPTERQIYETQGLGWHGIHPAFCSILELDGQPIAYAGIADRTIRIDRGTGAPVSLRVAGPQNVSVHPNHRGRAYSLAVLAMALNHALLHTYDVGLLFCLPELARLYSKAAWRTIPNPITRIHDGRESPLPDYNIPMFLPLRLHEFPPGPVHLQGDDW